MAKTQVRCGYCYRRLNKVSHLIYCEGLSYGQLLKLKLRPLTIRLKKVKIVVLKTFLQTVRDPGVKLAFMVAGILAAIVFGGGILYFLAIEVFKRGL